MTCTATCTRTGSATRTRWRPRALYDAIARRPPGHRQRRQYQADAINDTQRPGALSRTGSTRRRAGDHNSAYWQERT